jgi:DNA-directed RNA polymerase specialized sigma54-like protein
MLREHLTLTPQLQQALRLLQLSSLEFEQDRREALDTNPFLEGGGCGARGCRDTRPRAGLFEFKRFFSRQLATDNGGACSATAIRALLRELIAYETPRDPLSDAQLARLLAGQGLRVARRTVTKYFTLMRVPSVELRRAMARNASA